MECYFALRVEPLPPTVTNAMLRDLLVPYGGVRASVAFTFAQGVAKHLGWGVAQFAAQQDMDRAYAALNGASPFGSRLHLLPARRSEVEYVFGIPAATASAVPISHPLPQPPPIAYAIPTPVAPLPQPVLRARSPPRELDTLAAVPNAAQRSFFVIATLAACATPRDTVPIEIAVVCFTPSAGEAAYFHSVLAPGTLPVAVQPSATWQTAHIHGIAADTGEKHYDDVWNRLFAMLRTHAPDPQQPPTLFGRGPEQCNACISWLAKMAGRNNPLPRVAPVEDLVEALALKMSGRRLAMTETADGFAALGGRRPVPTQLCNVHAKMPPPPIATAAFWRCALADARALCSTVVSMITANSKPQQ